MADLYDLGGGKQSGGDLPALPDGPRNAEGNPTGNPSGGYGDHPALFDGEPVSPAVARPRGGAALAAGHGPGGAGPGGGK
jgi:hypothetical protein